MGLLYMFNNTDMKLIGISYYLDMKKELRLLEILD